MEHSQDDLRVADSSAQEVSDSKPVERESAAAGSSSNTHDNDHKTNNYDRRKRKADFDNSSMHHGSRGDRGRDDGKRHKKGDMGRAEYFRDQPDKRAKTELSREKRLNGNAATYGTTFSKEEIDAEERKPKRKVAVLIGYSGTGYKGMQITPSERTIEGDLFQAFIKAGAVSKANADDPKKASLVRCARTDKGVHAAGNMISLKMIVEEQDIVEKINSHLSPQIRVWGIERTTGSFSCYQACDSRWYEYLIPSHAFLPPHPSSWLAKQLEEMATEADDREGYEARQQEVRGFWEEMDEVAIKPILESIDEDLRWEVIKALQGEEEASAKATKTDDVEPPTETGASIQTGHDLATPEVGKAADAVDFTSSSAVHNIAGDNEPIKRIWKEVQGNKKREEDAMAAEVRQKAGDSIGESLTDTKANPGVTFTDSTPAAEAANVDSHVQQDVGLEATQLSPEVANRTLRLRAEIKRLRIAYNTAKRKHRIPRQRIKRIQAALSKFVGSINFHNYTVQKSFRDPSAKRHIKSFVVNPVPILIGDGADDDKSEWLSLKVHGQSFMMHQIRKMVGMIALLVRCGSNLDLLTKSFGEDKCSIPKVPGLGLLLERPVFDTYNATNAAKYQREPLRFDKYEREMEAFKQSEIYQRIFREEEERNEFGRFFNHVDNFKEPYFLYVTSKGLEATKGAGRKGASLLEVEGSEDGEEAKEDDG